jgi:hypothetical protein
VIAVASVWLTSIGQALLAVIVAVIGYVLHHKANRIEVMVNGRTTDLVARVAQLEKVIVENGHAIPASPPPVLMPGETPPA